MIHEMDDKMHVPHDAPWKGHMKHKPDPNRVGSRQIPSPGQFDQRPAGQLTPAPQTDFRPVNNGALDNLAMDPQATQGEPSYYDVPILQQPVWKWQIASYFYLGGLSAGAYMLGRVADRAGGPRFHKLSRIASAVALASILPCPGLLIWDLGDPKRFHHMLRVWKPSTPMNLGTWAITAYGAHAAFDVMRQYLNARGERLSPSDQGILRKLMNNGTLMLIHDAAGVPLSLVVASYTGVLLTCTSNPLWCKNNWLAPLFTASAISTGAEAISLAMDRTDADSDAQATLRHIDTVSHVVELLTMRGFMKEAGEKADPLRHGRMKTYHRFSIGAILAAEVLKYFPVPQRLQKPKRVLSMALGLAGGLVLRCAMVFGGHESAADPHQSRLVSRPGSKPAEQHRTGTGKATLQEIT